MDTCMIFGCSGEHACMCPLQSIKKFALQEGLRVLDGSVTLEDSSYTAGWCNAHSSMQCRHAWMWQARNVARNVRCERATHQNENTTTSYGEARRNHYAGHTHMERWGIAHYMLHSDCAYGWNNCHARRYESCDD
jgi:hypothetical protein